MAMTAIDRVTTALAIYFDKLPSESRGLDTALCPTIDIQDAEGINLQDWGTTVATARTRAAGASTNTSTIDYGRQAIITPPVLAEQIQVEFAKISAGISETATATTAETAFYQRADRFLRQMILMSRAKSVIDLIRTGQYTVTDASGAGVVSYDFERDAALSMTYDATASGADPDEAMAAVVSALRDKGANEAQIGILLGANWLKFLTSSETFQSKAIRSDFAQSMNLPLVPGTENNPQGLATLGSYSVDGLAFPIRLMTYNPILPYRRTTAGDAAPYIPVDEMCAFPIGAGVTCVRSVNVPEAGRIVKRTGEIVIDGYVTDDAPSEYIRGQSRTFCLFPDIDHTATVVGTFA